MGAVLRAVRGATTLDEDSAAEMQDRVGALVGAILERNGLEPGDLVSAIFTATEDVTSAFPASAARTIQSPASAYIRPSTVVRCILCPPWLDKITWPPHQLAISCQVSAPPSALSGGSCMASTSTGALR